MLVYERILEWLQGCLLGSSFLSQSDYDGLVLVVLLLVLVGAVYQSGADQFLVVLFPSDFFQSKSVRIWWAQGKFGDRELNNEEYSSLVEQTNTRLLERGTAGMKYLQ